MPGRSGSKCVVRGGVWQDVVETSSGRPALSAQRWEIRTNGSSKGGQTAGDSWVKIDYWDYLKSDLSDSWNYDVVVVIRGSQACALGCTNTDVTSRSAAGQLRYKV